MSKGRNGIDWYGLVWIGMDWYGLAWIGMDRYGIACVSGTALCGTTPGIFVYVLPS